MSIPAIYNEVISGLLLKTKASGVVWNKTTDNDTFIVYFSNFSLSIRQSHKSDFNNNYRESWITVELIDENGDRIDSFSVEEGDDDWGKIEELYTLSRRSALSIDVAVQEMLAELGKTTVIGKRKKDEMSSNDDDDPFTDDIPF